MDAPGPTTAKTPKPVRWIGIGIDMVFVIALLLYRHFDLGRLLTLENLKASRDGLVAQFNERPLITVLTFFGVYVAMAALSIPGAAILTLAAGAMLLGIFPLIAKAVVGSGKRRKVGADWTKPASFDRNLVVIGAGSGGLVTAYIAAAVKAGMTLVESHKMGGDCLNAWVERFHAWERA